MNEVLQQGDVSSLLSQAEAANASAKRDLAEALSRVPRWTGTAEDLAARPVPTLELVSQYEQTWRKAVDSHETAERKLLRPTTSCSRSRPRSSVWRPLAKCPPRPPSKPPVTIVTWAGGWFATALLTAMIRPLDELTAFRSKWRSCRLLRDRACATWMSSSTGVNTRDTACCASPIFPH